MDKVKCQVEGCEALGVFGIYQTNRDGTKEWIKVCDLHEKHIGRSNMNRAGGRYSEEDRKRNSR